MPTGFIYIVKTVMSNYMQRSFDCVPTVWRDRIYFASCKIPMRPRVERDDWIFGVSPSSTRPRRVVFVAQVAERITFADAYRRFPALRGPAGPISVKPVTRLDPNYALAHYEPIPGATHENSWTKDVATEDLDRFFTFHEPDGFKNRWLGAVGPIVDDEMLAFFNQCPVFGQSANGTRLNCGRPTAPIALGGQFRGLHLETDQPDRLLALCRARVGERFPTALGPRTTGRSSRTC